MKILIVLVIIVLSLFIFGCTEDNQVIGGDTDEGGCLVGAGYSWCPSTEKCQRMWEEYCPEFSKQFKINDFDDCVAAGFPIMESYPRQCSDGNNTFSEIVEFTCTEEERNADVCTQQYDPVCANVQVECVTAPCDPIKQTFSNSCFACQNDRVISYQKGEC